MLATGSKSICRRPSFYETRLVNPDEKIGVEIIDMVVSGSLLSVESEDDEHCNILIWSPIAAEQLGTHVRRLAAQESGSAYRKLQAQAETIEGLADERRRRRAAEKYSHDLRRVALRLVDEAVSAASTPDWCEQERKDYRLWLMESAGFAEPET